MLEVAYSYLQANLGDDIRHAYSKLKKAFDIVDDNDFLLLLI